MSDAAKSDGVPDDQPIGVHFDTRPRRLTRWRRMQISLIAGAVYGLVRLLGPTLRFEVLGWHHAERIYAEGGPLISAFWHRAILSILWWARRRGVVVMISTNFDGEWARRVVERLGFGSAQGSSTRGGLRGLAIMAQRLEQGHDVAFAIDGPRGPRYVAKPGPVMLARRTGCPILVFHVGLERGYTFRKSWDHLQIPYPFSRAVIVFPPPIHVPAEADRELLASKHAEMQSALERARNLAESWFTLLPQERARYRQEWNS